MIRALLTIDDVSSENTPAIVDYLCGKNIPVIMFMVGEWAQKHPDEYRDLLVRVAGYSAYFVELNKALQDDIIGRTSLSFDLAEVYYD